MPGHDDAWFTSREMWGGRGLGHSARLMRDHHCGQAQRTQAHASRFETVDANDVMRHLEKPPYQLLSGQSMKSLRLFTKSMIALAFAAVLAFAPATAQDREAPYWASLKFDEVNMRVGPSQEYPIDWVYKRTGLPVKVVRLLDGWRLVRDPDGTQGWVASSQLSPTRSALVVGEGLAAMHASPKKGATVSWRAEPGVVGDLLGCDGSWCELDIGGRTGWINAGRLWGVRKP